MKAPIVALLFVAGCRDHAPPPRAATAPAPPPIDLPAVDVAWTTPGHGDGIVAIDARSPATRLVGRLRGGVSLAVAGAGTLVLAARFGDLSDDGPRPVVDLRATGVSVRRSDGHAHGEIPWPGEIVDVAAVRAAHEHVMLESDAAWRETAIVTVDDTVTVQQLVAVIAALRADGATRFGLEDEPTRQ